MPVWPLQLDTAGIEHHLQASRLRGLLWLFGSYVPMNVLVPPERAPDAERVLRELLE